VTQTPEAGDAPVRKRAGGLSGMLIADLRTMATGLGVAGATTMKKAQLVEAIKAAQAGPAPAARRAERSPRRDPEQAPAAPATPEPEQPEQPEQPERTQPEQRQPEQRQPEQRQPEQRQPERTQPEQKQPEQKQPEQTKPDQQQDTADGADGGDGGDGEGRGRNRRRRGRERNRPQQDGQASSGQNQGGQQGNQQGNQGGQQGGQQSNQGKQGQGGKGKQGQGPKESRDGGQQGQGRHEPDTTVLDDDVLVPAAGIVDVLDNYAFVRTSGYLAGPDDVYLSLSLVRRFGLRRGDAVVGQVRQPREGERKEKFNPMVRIDSVNGAEPDRAEKRPHFSDLVAIDPQERLRLETGRDDVLGRVLDLATPLGKGQRGLVLAPADAGATTVLRTVAASLSANHPECHLMAVLVDARPEEATVLARSFRGEVVSSSLDRTAAEHVSVAELALERATRLVELGHDVVLLVDGLTTLGRAHQHAAPTHGRSSGPAQDPGALQAPRRFLGAARNVEAEGSLTILATARTGSASGLDAAILDELGGAANLVVRLRADLARERVFPALDLLASRTRQEEALVGREELAAVSALRGELAGATPAAALTELLERLAGTQSNIELLTRLHQRRAPAGPAGTAGARVRAGV